VRAASFSFLPDQKQAYTACGDGDQLVEMAKRAGRPGPARARARAGPGPVKPGQNRAGPVEPAGLSFCPSPARSGPKRAGPARLARKNGPKSGLNGPVSTF
jgi:hypothetical protein